MSNLTPEVKNSIDNMSYSQLLNMWRNEPSGSYNATVYLQGEAGSYFQEVMEYKKSQMSSTDAVQVSKNIGF